MATIHAGQSPPDVVNDMAARLHRNGIDPNNVHKVNVLPLRLVRIHEVDRDEHGNVYTVGEGDNLSIAIKRPQLRLLLR